MKGALFEHLPALQEINLEANECIDQNFQSEEEVRGIFKTVNGTCGFDKNGTEIACEEVSSASFSDTFDLMDFFMNGLPDDDSHETCNMKSYTIIRDNNYTISDMFNEEVEVMDLSGNRNIEFLPILLYDTFPSITIYHAARCSIREILKENFKNLDLKEVNLQENQIYAVSRDTFEGLDNLRDLNLSKFKLWLKYTSCGIFLHIFTKI